MKINIQSPHFTVEKSLTELVNKKVTRLSKFNERILKADVCLKFDKSGKDDDKVCEIKVTAPEKNLFAIRKCLTFEDAITQATKALEQQIEKRKTRRENNTNNDVMNIEEEETGEEELE